MQCIICHLDILDGLDVKEDCPNGHSAHDDCLKEWLVHSTNCPVCSTPYTSDIIQKYKGFVDQREKAKEDFLKEQMRQEAKEKIGPIPKPKSDSDDDSS